MDLFDLGLKVFGPLGLVIGGLAVIVRVLWKEHLKDSKVAPDLLERTITALNASASAIDKNTAAKEANTQVGRDQIQAFERQEEAFERANTQLDRLREAVERSAART